MRIRRIVLAALLAAGCTAALAADVDAAVDVKTGIYTDAIEIVSVVAEGDRQLDLADACLTRLFFGSEDRRTAELLKVLTLTDFDLIKVSIKEVGNGIRFGFEFNKRQALKTVYWEADCPVNGQQESVKQRTTASRIDRGDD